MRSLAVLGILLTLMAPANLLQIYVVEQRDFP